MTWYKIVPFPESMIRKIMLHPVLHKSSTILQANSTREEMLRPLAIAFDFDGFYLPHRMRSTCCLSRTDARPIGLLEIVPFLYLE